MSDDDLNQKDDDVDYTIDDLIKQCGKEKGILRRVEEETQLPYCSIERETLDMPGRFKCQYVSRQLVEVMDVRGNGVHYHHRYVCKKRVV